MSIGITRQFGGGKSAHSHPTGALRNDSTLRLPQIAVVALHPIAGDGALRALASVRLGSHLTIHGWRLVQQAGQRPWVSVPMETRDEPEGQSGGGRARRRYFPRVEVPPAWQEAIGQAVIAVWNDYEATGVLPTSTVIGGQGQ